MSIDPARLSKLVGSLFNQSHHASDLGRQAEIDGEHELADDLYDIGWRMQVAARRFKRKLRVNKLEAPCHTN